MNQTAPDPVTRLSRTAVAEYARKKTIYGPGQPCRHLYLVQSGRVVISNSVDGGAPMVTRIVGPGGFFGDSVLRAFPDESESAVALDATSVMAWTAAEIEEQVNQNPRVGLTLVKYFAQRCGELNARLEAIAFHKTAQRVMLALLQLSESLGTAVGLAQRMAPITHQVLAEYVGTSREIVTSHLAGLRRAGLVKYSRKHFDVNVAAMKKRLQAETAVEARGAG